MANKRKSLRRDDNWAGKFCIKMILIVFVAVMTVQIIRVYQKNQEYIAREAELQRQYEAETVRQEEIKEYERYIQSQEYVEDVAKSKLGLLYENEIIFRETKK